MRRKSSLKSSWVVEDVKEKKVKSDELGEGDVSVKSDVKTPKKKKSLNQSSNTPLIKVEPKVKSNGVTPAEDKSKRKKKQSPKGDKRLKVETKEEVEKIEVDDVDDDESSKPEPKKNHNSNKVLTKTPEEKLKLRKEQKELKEKRKKSDNKYFELKNESKKIWEIVRREDCPKAEREKHMDHLMKMVKGNVKHIIRAHDTVRVIECIVAHGSDDQRGKLYEEVKDIIVELCKLPYAKFFVQKMLSYGSKEQKTEIIKQFYGKVKSLLNHNEAATIVEYAFNEVANATQRAHLIQEYFGPEFALFKDETASSLQQVLSKVNDSQKNKILEEMKEELIKLTNKNSWKHSIAHFIFNEFFKHASNSMKLEVISCLNEIVVEMLHTRPGARVAMECLWFGTAKDRKVIVKSFKKFVAKIAQEEQGYLVLLAAFDCVDDTKLIEKVIISELVDSGHVVDLVKDKHASKVFQYILTPRDPRWFHKDIVAILEKGDNNPHSKKDTNVRREELKEFSSPYFLKIVENHCKDMMFEGSTALVAYAILTEAVGDKTDALTALVKYIGEDGVYHSDANNQHVIERPPSNAMIKKLLVWDKQNPTKAEFSKLMVDIIPSTVLRSYIGCNRGCFLLISLIETGIKSVAEKVKSAMVGVNSTLRDRDYKGAALLLELLKK